MSPPAAKDSARSDGSSEALPWLCFGAATAAAIVISEALRSAGISTPGLHRATSEPRVRPPNRTGTPASAPPVTGCTRTGWPAAITRAAILASGTPIANVTSPHVHGSLLNGTAYYYVVTASNVAGESGPHAVPALSS